MNRLLGVELMKLRRSGMVWIAVGAPLFLTLQGIANFLRYSDTMFAGSTRTKWEILYEQCMIMYPSLLLPLVITVMVALLARLEHSQNGWKQLLALPVTREQVYKSKLVIACLLVLLNLGVLSIGTLVGGLMVGIEGDVPYELILGRGLLAFVATLPVIAIQFVLSYRFSHVGVPLAIGTALAAPTLFAANSERFWLYDPWTYPVMAYFGPAQEGFTRGDWMYAIACGLFLLIIWIGLQEFKKRDVV
ncbi:ABC transporter permease [Aneurinibacillus aneurinilyticus]|uniref:ABC transporter permease subunit n=1 Tax=Aneurinibacillus aneurinilyticus TaxID=1391 RepID=A0A848CN52_ANEAE|nr:ABC transporter permease [Aneurinibacillus aneurinilyticus]NME98774.1 ABC transporter permease subunit [Aneurinibacillus aneurinilyticus]